MTNRRNFLKGCAAGAVVAALPKLPIAEPALAAALEQSTPVWVQNTRWTYIHASDPDCEIWYTTDGSAPAVSGQKYTGPIAVDNQTIKAIAFRR